MIAAANPRPIPPVSDGGEDAASGGKLIPAVKAKPLLDEAHDGWGSFAYLIPFHEGEPNTPD